MAKGTYRLTAEQREPLQLNWAGQPIREGQGYGGKPENIPATWLQPKPQNWGDTQRVLLKYDLPKKFLLFPCQFWKHKNHTTVFGAIHLLRERGIDDAALVCTAYPHDYRFPNYAAELREFLTTHRLEAAVRVLGLIPRHDQVQLMRDRK